MADTGDPARQRIFHRTLDRLNVEVSAALDDAAVKARIAEPGSVPLVLGSAAFAAFLAAETAKWAKVVKYAGVKPS